MDIIEDCTVRNFITFTLRKIVLKWSNQEGWDGLVM